MRRIISVLAVMAVMAAMLVAMAVPAFAASDVAKPPEGYNYGACHKQINQEGNALGISDHSAFNNAFDPFDPRLDKGNPHPGVSCPK